MSEAPLPSLSSLTHKRPRINDAGGYQLAPSEIIITLRGWIELLQRRRESDSLNAFLSESKDTWRSLLEYAEAHTEVDNELSSPDINPLSSVLKMKDRVVGKTDREVAMMYEEEFINYVIFRQIKGPTAYKPFTSARDDKWFMSAIEYHFLIFLGRTNGSINQVLKAITYSAERGRKNEAFHHPIPASIFVAAIRMIARINFKNSYKQAGRPHIQELEGAIMESPSY